MSCIILSKSTRSFELLIKLSATRILNLATKSIESPNHQTKYLLGFFVKIVIVVANFDCKLKYWKEARICYSPDGHICFEEH